MKLFKHTYKCVYYVKIIQNLQAYEQDGTRCNQYGVIVEADPEGMIMDTLETVSFINNFCLC